MLLETFLLGCCYCRFVFASFFFRISVMEILSHIGFSLQASFHLTCCRCNMKCLLSRLMIFELRADTACEFRFDALISFTVSEAHFSPQKYSTK